MKIIWKITKKRGNWRPILEYTCTKEDWEMPLLIHNLKMISTIPAYHGNYSNYCLPEQNERCKDWKPDKYLILETPHTDNNECQGKLILPWRPGAHPEYPEVEESFKLLQKEYEKALKEAYDSGPFEETGNLEMSSETKRYIAPGIVKEKMLRVVNA